MGDAEGPSDPKDGGKPLPSARDRTPAEGSSRGSVGGRRRSGRGRRREGRAKPPAARTLAPERPSPETEHQRDVPAAEVEVDGVKWVVRVLGRSGARAPGAPPPLLLLGFQEADQAERAPREVLTVGSALSELSEDALARAFADSRIAGAADRPGEKPFFDGASERRRR